MKRRDFIKTAAIGSAAAGSLSLPGSASAGTEKVQIQNYRKLGSTGLKMSDVSFGAGSLPSASMILRAVDMGINYFDTAPDYGDSEDLIGQAMRRIKRDKVILATKFCDPWGYPAHLSHTQKKSKYIKVLEDSLTRLNTDYVDICFVHAIGEHSRSFKDEKQRLLHPEMLAAVEDLKKAGKIRFLGVSSHGPNNVEELLGEAVKSGHYQVIMPAFNFLKFPKLPQVIQAAHKKEVGVIAMKTLAGARGIGLEPKGEKFALAALKWVLGHKEVSGLIISIKNIGNLNLYLQASGQAITQADKNHLNWYASKFGNEICRTGCGDCLNACGQGLDIATILRYTMYFEEYGLQKRALKAYAALPINAGLCANCVDPACENACPYGLEVQKLLTKAHKKLSLNEWT